MSGYLIGKLVTWTYRKRRHIAVVVGYRDGLAAILEATGSVSAPVCATLVGCERLVAAKVIQPNATPKSREFMVRVEEWLDLARSNPDRPRRETLEAMLAR
jgi:hypothetical protein